MNEKFSKESILSRLRDENLIKNFHIKSIGLFGSYLHDDAADTSDIDILVDIENPSFDQYMDLKFYLEEIFGRKVDLVLPDSLKPRIKKQILDEVQLVEGL